MPSERIQRQIDRLLDEAEAALARREWARVRDLAQDVLALDPENGDGRALLAAAGRAGAGTQSDRAGMQPATAQATPQPLPSSFAAGRYAVRAFLGEGAKKRVYLAHDQKLDRDVAFALIKTDGLDADGLVRIRREAQAMGRLGDHAQIVTVYDTGDEAGAPWIVSQHMAGGSVEDLLAKQEQGRIAPERAMRIAEQVALALAHAHAHGIVHRDLKPGNVWLDAEGNAALGDFGLALAMDRSRMTMQGMMVGTVSYMAPEQALGKSPDARSDLYALGAMLYEMVAGRPPFLGDDAVGVISQHINTEPVAPSWHEPSVPKALEALILRLLAKSPDERPQWATEVAQGLRQILDRSTVGESAPASQDVVTDLRRLDWGRFVGRQEEMAQLKSVLEQALSGKTALAFIAGEPGIGKTRLAEEFAVYSGLRGAQVLTGRSYEGQSTVPYRPFVEALRQYTRSQPDGDLRRQMGPGAPEIATMVSDVRERFPDISPAPALDAEAERLRLFDSVAAFLRNASAAQPLVLYLDDLHWADRPSLLLLQHVIRGGGAQRLMVLATYRDVELDRTHPLSESLGELRRLPGFTRLSLRGLGEQSIEELLASIDSAEDSVLQRETLAHALYEETEGNPFFIREVLSHLVEEGMIVRQGGRWVGRVTSVSDLGIPEGVLDVIGRRVARLGDACTRALTRASTMLRGFTWEAFRAINADTPEEELLDLLEEALSAQLIAERRDDARPLYEFTHTMIRQTLYERLIGPRRVLLHREVAHALEELYGGSIEAHVGELAYHYYQAAPGGDVQKAVAYCVRAGERARSLNGHEDAVNHYQRALQALEIAPQDDERQRAELLVLVGDGQWHSGKFEEARRSYESAATIAARIGDARIMAAAAAGFGGDDASFAAGQVDGSLIELLTQALDMLPPGDSPDRALTLARLSSALTFEPSSRPRLQEASDEATEMARRLGDPVLVARVLTFRHWALWSPENPRERLEMCDEIVQLGDQAGEAPITLQGRLWRALDRLELGDLDSAQRDFDEYSRLVDEVRSTYYKWFTVVWHGMRALMDGRFDEAEAFAHQALAVGQGTGNANAFQVFGGQLVFVRYDQKRLAEIEPLLSASVAQNPNLASWRCVLALIYSETGRLEEARNLVASLAADRCAALPRDFLFLLNISVLVIASRQLDDRDTVSRLYEAGMPFANSLSVMPGVCVGPVQIYLGTLATARRDWTAAERHFALAEPVAERLRAPYLMTSNALERARMLVTRDGPGDRRAAEEVITGILDAARERNWRRILEEALALRLQAQGIEPATIDLRTSIDRVTHAVTAERPAAWEQAVAPDGTVTLLFSDIEGSTLLTERLGDARWQELLRQHNALVRDCVAAHGGFEVKHLGDGFMVAFQSAKRGLDCAVAIQRAFAREGALPEPVHVRIGLHAGDTLREGDDFFGKNVVIASRVAGLAKGGEILVSSVLRSLVDSATDPALFGERRDVELKGLTGTYEVYAVRWTE